MEVDCRAQKNQPLDPSVKSHPFPTERKHAQLRRASENSCTIQNQAVPSTPLARSSKTFRNERLPSPKTERSGGRRAEEGVLLKTGTSREHV